MRLVPAMGLVTLKRTDGRWIDALMAAFALLVVIGPTVYVVIKFWPERWW
jgi:hypothetical protein